ncbi:hypothetical protein EDC01DRAFT_12950 [Geopyxis carbonaria]|nr:hypothetical protein EDC01DRAFT_12950 [Geopyxis carbonaria]
MHACELRTATCLRWHSRSARWSAHDRSSYISPTADEPFHSTARIEPRERCFKTGFALCYSTAPAGRGTSQHVLVLTSASRMLYITGCYAMLFCYVTLWTAGAVKHCGMHQQGHSKRKRAACRRLNDNPAPPPLRHHTANCWEKKINSGSEGRGLAWGKGGSRDPGVACPGHQLCPRDTGGFLFLCWAHV